MCTAVHPRRFNGGAIDALFVAPMAQRGAIEPLSAGGALISSGLAVTSANKQNLEGNLTSPIRKKKKETRN